MKKLTVRETDLLEIVLAAAHASAAPNVHVGWSQMTNTTALENTDSTRVDTNGVTDVVLITGSANKRMHVDYLHIYNRDTIAHTFTLKSAATGGGTERFISRVVLQPNETASWAENGWVVTDANGRAKKVAEENTGYTGRAMAIFKVGTAAEAVGQWYSHAKDTGFPGAWAPGTPGLAGRATDGTAAGDAGCIPWQNPASGSIYLTQFTMSSSVAHFHLLYDCLWVNSGIVVTTTTAQTINSVAFPARDVNGSTNGEGVMVGILVTTATTNAGAITNTTMSYTNSDGTAGRTATIASFPATAVIGTIVWFQLAAGDKGVRSIQTVTLGTSYAGGAVSLIAARWLADVPMQVVNLGASAYGANHQNPGVRLYSGTCMLTCYIASATTATNSSGVVTMMER